ncbi:MAG TPA: hypothetical protein VGJ15_04845 [Pirellulales bacterium]|jgi:hypothetical protein
MQNSVELLDDYRWLLGPEAAAWLDRLARLEGGQGTSKGGPPSLVQLTQRMRGELSANRVHLLLEQTELRRRAAAKFPVAASMFFTRQGLEQATDAVVAVYKASRFPAGGALADFCCGMGGDLVALSQCGPVLAIDRDLVSLLLADANLHAVGQSPLAQPVRFEATNVAQLPHHAVTDLAAWHIDPDRRPAGRRTTRVELHEPQPDVLRSLLEACPNAAIKLAPAATMEEPWWHDAELQWISRARQCRQLVAWFGNLAENPGQRRATVLIAENSRQNPLPLGEGRVRVQAIHFVGQPDEPIPVAPQIGRYLFEPDAAVLAAKLEGALAQAEGLSAVAGGVAYFTADRPEHHPALVGFEVLEVLPYRAKPLREWLAARNLGRLEIKKRGVPLDPAVVQRELKNDGTEQAVVLLAKIAGRVMAVVAKRLVR